MNIRETLELIAETRNVLIEDYKYIHQKEPTDKDLLQHIKVLFKEERAKEIIEEVLSEEEIESSEDVYRILLVAAASIKN
jgi:hypothetical protein